MNLLYLLLGWLLGLFSPLIYDRISKQYRREEIKRGILTELKESKFKLVGNVYLLGLHLERYNRDLLQWLRPHIQGYEGTHSKDTILKAIESQLDLDDDQLAALCQWRKGDARKRLSLKQHKLPFLDSMIDSLSVFDSEFQNRVFEIRAQMNLLNDEIDQARFYFRMTFDSNLSPENHDVIIENLKGCYSTVLEASQRLADRITELENFRR